jgi:molybdate transport system substrate-binding protein
MKNPGSISLAAALALLTTCMSTPAQQRTVRIAAAADLKFALAELAPRFEGQAGTKIEASFGSSGNFFSQIQNGAPFDLFFSADVEYPKRLAATGTGDPASLYEYAVGRIVIWIPPGINVDVSRDPWNVLLDASVQRVAIANPQHAPYGRAAAAAMQKAGVYDRVKPKLVYGESVSQAAQFVQSGSAQAGIIALSLALSPPMKGGKYWLIPADRHDPIVQAAIILRSAKNKDGAALFLEFIRSPAGRDILSRFGFQFPSPGKK